MSDLLSKERIAIALQRKGETPMFWWGLICGLFIGSWIGVFIMAICVMGDKKYDPRVIRDIPDIRKTDQ